MPRPTYIASWSNALPTTTDLVRCSSHRLQELVCGLKAYAPRGAGRSFGDAAYLGNGTTVSSELMQSIVSYDEEAGTIDCGAGLQIGQILTFLEHRPWSLPVLGGTQWVTVGGAIGSDIHGKNHPVSASFGNVVQSLEVLCGDGELRACSREVEPELFSATIGGMGLTGFILTAKLKLKKRSWNLLHVRTNAYQEIEDALNRFRECDSEYQVSWLDLAAKTPKIIHYEADFIQGEAPSRARSVTVPFPRIKVLRTSLVQALNKVRFFQHRNIDEKHHYRTFVHAVDVLKHWNKLYGKRGFQEYQYSVPAEQAALAFKEFVRRFREHGLRPTFAILKWFGSTLPGGLLSFPQPGYTLMADFETREKNRPFFEEMTDLIISLGGRIYLAKDSYVTSPEMPRMYKDLESWQRIVRRYDPDHRVRTDLSERLALKPW